MRDGNFTIGIDLGQIYDYTAMCVVERLTAITAHPFVRDVIEDHYHVRDIVRWPHETLYKDVIRDVGAYLKAKELEEACLVLDGTGVGKEVVWLFLQAFRNGDLGKHWPVDYVITGGREITQHVVPKRELVAKMQTLVQSERLLVADGLSLSETLGNELRNFRMKTTPAGNQQYESAREADHDDIVLATALACWYRHSYTDPRSLDDAYKQRQRELAV